MFLVWWNPTTWLSDVSDSLLGTLIGALRTLFYFLSVQIYKVMIYLYKLFEVLCGGRLLDNAVLKTISTRIGLVLGIIMLFYIIISFVRMLIEPDTITDSKKGAVNVIKRVLIVIVLLGVSTSAFELLYTVQAVVVKSNIIGKIVLPFSVETDHFGNALAAELFTSFYTVDNAFYDEDGNLQDVDDLKTCESISLYLKDRIYSSSDFELGYSCLNSSVTRKDDNTEIAIMDFNWLFMLGAGIAVIYFLFSYCIAVGVRMIQLAVLEIVSPMAIVSYLSPKQDNMFSKWLKTYFSTYIEVFIRILIINLMVFLIATILDNEGGWEFWNTIGDTDTFTENIIVAVMVVSLLAFAKKAPDLLKELGLGGGKFGGFHMKDALGLNAIVGGAAGAGAGFFGGLVGGQGAGKLSGAAVGLLHGGKKGMTSKSFSESMRGGYGAAKDAALKTEARIAAGGSRFVLPGAQARAAHFDKEKEKLEGRSKFASSVSGHVDAIKERALSQINSGKFTNSTHIRNRNVAQQSIDALQEKAKNLKMDVVKRSDYGSTSDYLNAVRAARTKLENQQRQISFDIQHYQDIVNTEEKAAINDFVVKKSDDAVLLQHVNEINAELANRPSGVDLAGGVLDWSDENNGLDALGNSAKSLASDVSVGLIDNRHRGERARADAKK